MEVFVNGFEALLIHVGVDLGRGDIGVSQEFLDDPEVGAVFEEMGREGMPEEVGIDVLVDPGLFGPFLDDLANAVGRDRTTSNGEKDMRRGFSRHQCRSLEGQVLIEGGEGLSSDWNEAGFVSLAGDPQEVVVLIEILKPGAAEF